MSDTPDPPDPADRIVTPTGAPARPAVDRERRCPSCGAPPTRRVASQGFGHPHDVCGVCGYEFYGESTV